MRPPLTPGQVASYRRDGVLRLRGVVTGRELDELRRAADELTAAAVEDGRRRDARAATRLRTDHGFDEWHELDETGFLFGRDPEGRRVFRRATRLWDRDPIFRIVTANPWLVAAAEQLVGDPVLPANDAFVVKMPGAGAAVPWHRDPSGRALLERTGDASSCFTCDVYVDDADVDDGCVWAIPGTHRTTDPPPRELDFGVAGARPLPAQAGDVLLHCTGVLHGSPVNTSTRLRRTFYVHYRPEAALRRPEWAFDDERIAAARARRDTFAAERERWEAVPTGATP